MTIAIVLGILALFDALLAGFRAAAGRDGRIDKRSYFKIALERAAGGAIVLVAANALVVALLVAASSDRSATWAELQHAGAICVWIFGTFATLTLISLAFWLSPKPEYQLLSSIIVLGPLTLARPLVIVGGLAIAAASTGSGLVWLAAICAGASMLAFESLIGRWHARRWQRLVG